MATDVSTCIISSQLSTNSVRVGENSYLISSTGHGSTTAGNKSTQGRMKRFQRRFMNCFFTGQWPVLYVLMLAAIVNFLNALSTNESRADQQGLISMAQLAGHGANACVLLLYPFLGWLAEAYITYYRAIGCAVYLSLIGMTMAFSITITGVFKDFKSNTQLIVGLAMPPLLLSFLGNAFFNANAIQLGTDQMLEASSDQLSSFVYWYYWTTQIGNIIVYIITIIITNLPIYAQQDNIFFIVAILTFLQVSLLIIGVVIFHVSKKQLYIQPTRRNTIKNIFRVLWYAKQHKYPQRRSALTYWENTSPSRIDLGKEKYGGPFTAEQVEDTKSFLRILILLVTLFGLYTVNSSENLRAFILQEYNVTNNIELEGNGSNITIITPLKLLITNDPDFIPDLVIVLSIPLLQLIIKPILNNHYPGMLKRFGLGLLCAMLSSVSSLIIILIVDTHSERGKCTIKKLEHSMPQNVNYVLLMLLVPQVLLGLAKLLIFLTGLEFILAQAPRKVQGLLIGLWYMLGIITEVYSAVDTVNGIGKRCEPYIVSVVLTAVSVLAYMVIMYFYKYRNRDDIVDGYNLVVDKVARRIRSREQHRQREWSTSDITVNTVSSPRVSINSSTTLRETDELN